MCSEISDSVLNKMAEIKNQTNMDALSVLSLCGSSKHHRCHRIAQLTVFSSFCVSGTGVEISVSRNKVIYFDILRH